MGVSSAAARLAIGDLILDAESGSVTREGVALPLPPRTFELLLALARAHPRHVRRHELLEIVWPEEVVTDQTLSQRALLLRRALGDDPSDPRYIASDRGWGYRVVASVEELSPGPQPSREPPEKSRRAGRPSRPWGRLGAGGLGAIGILLLLAQRGPWEAPGRSSRPKAVEVAAIHSSGSDVAKEFVGERLRARITSALRAEPALRVPRAGGDPDGPAPEARIEGSMTAAGDESAVTLRLRDAGTGRVLWERRFPGSVYELFGAEDRIAGEVLAGVREAFGLPARAPEPTTIEEQVGRLCLRGEWLVRSWEGPSLRSGAEVYERALALDPRRGAAHAGLAIAYATLALLAELPPAEAAPPAREAARQANRFAPELPASHVAQGLVRLVFDADVAGAEPELRRAVAGGTEELWPLTAYGFYLQVAGRPDDSLPVLHQAEELDPHTAPLPFLVGRAHHLARRCAEALESYARALSLDPNLRPALFAAAECHSELRHPEAALDALRRERSVAGVGRPALAALDHAYASRGLEGLWATVCERSDVRPIDPVHVARACAHGGRIELALVWLERAASERSPTLLSAARDPALQPLRASPRYHRVMKQVGLPLAPS